MMQKNEDLVLGPWITFYGYQFGIENLTVFDNGSTSPEVIETLRRLEHAGGRVIWHHDTVGDWLNKGKLVEYVVRSWDKKAAEYDFVLPLDCDEFLALFRHDGLTCRRKDIHHYFDSLIGIKDVFNIPSWSFNVPGRPGWFYSEGIQKRFFASGTLDWLDHGFHNGRSRMSDRDYHTPLTFLHFHNKPFAIMREHSRRKLAPFVDVEDVDAVRSYRGDNDHVARNLLIDESDYYRHFDGKLQFEFTGLGDLIDVLGRGSDMLRSAHGGEGRQGSGIYVRLPRTQGAPSVLAFDPDRYLSDNLDVASSDHVALEHFMLCGYSEGRRVPAGAVGTDANRDAAD